MKLFLDDIRRPEQLGYLGWTWVQTADEAIVALATGTVEVCSLDHDLSVNATMGMPEPGEKTGYTVVCWMERTGIWPPGGVRVHSMNPAGKRRMLQVIEKHYGMRP